MFRGLGHTYTGLEAKKMNYIPIHFALYYDNTCWRNREICL